ncbi:MAG: DNA translocase FtsK [Patescibacteria group bacterium]
MPRARRKVKRQVMNTEGMELKSTTLAAISGLVQIVLGILLYLALQGSAGRAGEVIRQLLTFLFGSWGIIFPLFLVVSGMLRWVAPSRRVEFKRSIGLLLCLLSFLGLMHIGAPLEEIGSRRNELAGAVGFMVSLPFLTFFSRAVGYTALGGAFLAGLIITFEPDLASFFSWVKDRLTGPKPLPRRPQEYLPEEDLEEPVEETAAERRRRLAAEEEDLLEKESSVPELNIVRPAFARANVSGKGDKAFKDKVKKKRSDVIEMKDTRFEEWTFPSYDLLEDAVSQLTVKDEDLKKQALRIEEKLKEFEIDVTMKDARPGPTVTQFTLQPAEGIKLSRIGALKDDLALALAAPSLRIEAPIPGKSLVGIEMPNITRSTVHLREILESPAFVQSGSSLTLPLGRDVSGEAVISGLDDMPHLLIAGATGSGKSVCMNTFLTALLYQNAPHELKFILVDPKRVELTPYDGIPHLLTPVITEAERALQALRWAVAELGRRLHRFSEQGARNIEEFNRKQKDEQDMLPRIVVVVDELADLMMRQFRRDTETMIARIAQMARAVGMHLVIATQRPSVDVITGLIKANIPTRIAFRTVSSVDSRTILDGIGAEDLLGQGDMLFMDARTPNPVRIQGIYTSTKEMERVVNAVKIAGGGRITESIGMGDEDGEAANNDEGVTATTATINLDADDNGGDDLFFDAVRVVQDSGKASASLLQRQLKVGYARAARLLDIMEEKGLIGPPDGAKPRKLYVERSSMEG